MCGVQWRNAQNGELKGIVGSVKTMEGSGRSLKGLRTTWEEEKGTKRVKSCLKGPQNVLRAEKLFGRDAGTTRTTKMLSNRPSRPPKSPRSSTQRPYHKAQSHAHTIPNYIHKKGTQNYPEREKKKKTEKPKAEKQNNRTEQEKN